MEFPGNDAMLAHNRTNSYLTTYNDGFLKALKTDLSNTNPKSIMDYQRLYVEAGNRTYQFPQENSMAGPLALVPAAITFAKTQAAKFLAKRAALRTAPKIKNLVNGKGKKNVGGLTKKPPKTSGGGGGNIRKEPPKTGGSGSGGGGNPPGPGTPVRTSMWGKGPSVLDTAVGAGVGYYAGRKYKKKPKSKPAPKVTKT